MAENTLVEVFGTGTAQTVDKISIDKAGLQILLAAYNIEFTPKVDNSAEELIVALVLAWLKILTTSNREVDPVNRNIELRYDPILNYDTPTFNGQLYSRHTIEVSLLKQMATPTMQPANYA